MITAEQCRAARILLGWTAADLVTASRLGIATIKRFESGQQVQQASVETIQAALVDAGIIFLNEGAPSPAGGAGVRLAGNA